MKLYHLYGLAVASEFDCPEMTEITPEIATARGYPTISLRRATEPLKLPGATHIAPWAQVTPDAALFTFRDYAHVLIERPDRITVEMLPDALESDMRAYLLGTGFATLLHMRGLIPLHLSAIQTPEGVWAFTGPSGAGKSTRVTELHFTHGWPIICDDVAVLNPADDRPLLHGGVNRIKLWRDAVERFGIDPTRLTRDIMREDKFHLHAPEMFVPEPVALDVLHWIETAPEPTVTDRPGLAVEILLNTVYRPELAQFFIDRAALARNCMRFSQQIEIRSYRRPDSL